MPHKTRAIDALAAHHALDTVPEAWDKLIHGTISTQEAAATVHGHEPPSLIERSQQLFQAPSPADEERRLHALLTTHFPPPARHDRSRWAYGVLVALVAASLLLVLMPRHRVPAFDGGYALEQSPGLMDERDTSLGAQGAPRYLEGQPIGLGLRPRRTVTDRVGVRVFAVAGRAERTLAIDPTINEFGVISIAESPATMGLSVGRWQLWVVVGPPSHLPQARADLRDDVDAPYDVLVTEVEIVPDPPPP
ncbi:MAG: hypothetical protein AAGF11_09555 [Myxococcota bacterium]